MAEKARLPIAAEEVRELLYHSATEDEAVFEIKYRALAGGDAALREAQVNSES